MRWMICRRFASFGLRVMFSPVLTFVHHVVALSRVYRSASRYMQQLITIAWTPFVCWCQEVL